MDMREPRNNRRAIERLELIEFRTVDKARDHLADVELLLEVGRNNAVEFVDVMLRVGRLSERNIDGFFCVQIRNNAATNFQRVPIVLGVMVGNARFFRMHVGAAQIFGAKRPRRSPLSPAAARQEKSCLGYAR